jgi:hypothetical protein
MKVKFSKKRKGLLELIKQQTDLITSQATLIVDIHKLAQKNYNVLEEIRYSALFNSSIQNSTWLKDRSFSLNKAAANYSFMYILFRVLSEVKPQNILEFGLGQTTKMTSQYAKDSIQHDVIEHDQSWIDVYIQSLDSVTNTKIYCLPLIESLYDSSESKYKNERYANLDIIAQNKRYDLIIVDGPYGFGRKFPRTDIIDLIPQNIADEFVIILDDAERNGEKNTAKLIFQKLKENGIKYTTGELFGTKRQLLITSPKYTFVTLL